MTDKTPTDLIAELAEAFGEWLFRMHGVVSSCDHSTEGAALAEIARDHFAAHDCETCTGCLHDGHKCCGCHDGSCCRAALAAASPVAADTETAECKCGHPWDMHGPEVPGCCECRCRRLHTQDPA